MRVGEKGLQVRALLGVDGVAEGEGHADGIVEGVVRGEVGQLRLA